jgi:hypothetical protein
LALKAAILSLLACAALAQSPPQPAPGGHDGRGALAILRRDGVMFPFAAFNRNSWRVSWPVGLSTLDIPVTLAAIPERWWGTSTPNQWRAHLGNGESVDLELRAPVTFRAHCASRLGLSTTYRSALALPPVPVEPFPKDGIAVSGNVPIEPVEVVDLKSPDWASLAAALREDFDLQEEKMVRGVRTNTGWRHPLNREQRRKHPIRLESWYRSPSGEPGWTVSYIEAVRAYPPGPDDKGCGLETFVSGWVHHSNGELKRAKELRAKIAYCDRVGVMYMLPMGRIRPQERSYWIFQMSGWENEWYDVVEVGREKTRYVIEVFAGGRLTGCR